MSGDPYGRWRLCLLEELSSLAWRRLERALGGAGVERRAGALLADALQRKRAVLASVFPGPGPAEPCLSRKRSLACQLRLVERAWSARLSDLADDNELEVLRSDADGTRRATNRLAADWILSNAELAGRIVAG